MADPKLNARLGLDDKEFNRKLTAASEKVGGFGKKLASIQSFVTATGVIAAFTAIKKILESTQLSGDKLAASIKGVAGAAATAAQNLASADFSVSLKDAYKAAKRLEEAYDDLADRQRSLNILSSENTLKVAELQGILRNSTKTEKERQEAARQIKDIYAEEARLREQSMRGIIDAELTALTDKYHISQLQAQQVLDYATSYAKYSKDQQDALNAAMEAEKKLQTYLANNELTRDKVVNNLTEAANTTRDAVLPEMQKWIELWRPINDFSDKHRDQVAQLFIDYNNILNTRQRELNMADRINDRMDAQIEKARELIQITGSGKAAVGAYQQPGLLQRFGIDPTKLAGATGGAASNIDGFMVRITERMEAMRNVAMEVEDVFVQLFSTMGQGWKATLDVITDYLKRLAAEILAKAAIWALAQLIPGMGQLGAFVPYIFSGLTGITSGGGKMGGLAKSVAPITSGMNVAVTGRIYGNDIALSGARGSNSIYNGT